MNQVCRYAANAIACMVVARSQYNHDTKMTGLTGRDFIFHMDRNVRENFLPSDWSHGRDA